MKAEILSLCEAYKDYFPIGIALNLNQMKVHKELIKKHFNSITPENALKFTECHPEESLYTFEAADEMVRFAQENHMMIRGHTLVWHVQTPDWVFNARDGSRASRELVQKRMEEHIKTVVGKYKGEISYWDVVNEGIDDNDAFLRQTDWMTLVGSDYIDQAFCYAHEADPGALLFYNEYNDVISNKRMKIYDLVKGMKDRGIPIHGIGLQGHFSIYFPSIDDIRRSIETFAQLGVKIQLTEMDISLFQFQDHRTDIKKPTAEMLLKQAELYENVFEVLRTYRDIVNGVTFWGVADDYTWLDDFPVEGRKDWPLIFDENSEPKPAYYAITKWVNQA